MRTHLKLCFASILVVLGGCSQQEQPAAQGTAAGAEPQYQMTATIKDLMDGIVDPSADFIWESVATIVSAAGTEEKRPRTDEEWSDVRRNAVRLLEATNLLKMPGRRVAKPGEKAEDPLVELAPEKIEEALNADRSSWNAHAQQLHDATMQAFIAIEKKDTEGLLMSGEAIDQACEKCHLQYWYPDDAARQNAQLQGGLSQEKK